MGAGVVETPKQNLIREMAEKIRHDNADFQGVIMPCYVEGNTLVIGSVDDLVIDLDDDDVIELYQLAKKFDG